MGVGMDHESFPCDGLRSRDADRAALENVRRLIEYSARTFDAVSQSERSVIRCVGIVGAGIMGSAIAAAHLRRFVRVVLIDNDAVALERARRHVVAELADDIVVDQAERVASAFLETTLELDALRQCDLVIEAIVENLSAKQRLYEEVEPRLAEGAVWASNTSALPVDRLAARMVRPGRFCGLHFCHPVRHRPAVEVVRGSATSDATIATVLGHLRQLDRMPILVEDGPGFMINRLLFVCLDEALAMLLEGEEIGEIERAATDFGMAMGPFTAFDEIGLDTAFQAGSVLSEIFGDRLRGTPLLVRMVKARQLGCKTGAGFFVYPGKTINPVASELIDTMRCPPTGESPRMGLQQRLLGPIIAEAERILKEGKVRDRRDVDVGMIFGLGFPVVRGGLFWWADACRAAPSP